MNIQRTITIVRQSDRDLQATLKGFQQIQQALSEPCYNDGKPLRALALQRACYYQVKGDFSSQMTISAIRLVAGAYASARANKKPAKRPFLFKKARALFLIGKRGRDADFREDGTLSIWTTGGRKRLTSTIPQDFQATFHNAIEIDSLTVIERDENLLGRMTLTLDVPEPQGILPVGIDLNETNTLVAVDPDGQGLFISGKDVKIVAPSKLANVSSANIRPARQRRKILARREGFSNGLVVHNATGPVPSPNKQRNNW